MLGGLASSLFGRVVSTVISCAAPVTAPLESAIGKSRKSVEIPAASSAGTAPVVGGVVFIPSSSAGAAIMNRKYVSAAIAFIRTRLGELPGRQDQHAARGVRAYG